MSDLHALLTRAGVVGPYVLGSHSLAGLYARLYADRYPHDVAGLVLVEPGITYQIKKITLTAPRLAPLLAQGIPMDKMCAAAAARGAFKPGSKAFGACIAPPDPALPKTLNDLHTLQWKRPGTWRDYASEDEASGTSTSAEVEAAQRRYGNVPLIVVTAANPIEDLNSFPLPAAQREALLHLALQSRVDLPKLSSRGSNRIAAGCNHENVVDRCAAIVVSALNSAVDAARVYGKRNN